MLLAVVTNRRGSRRAIDNLDADCVPHLTVGALACGGGRVVHFDTPDLSDSWDVRWSICEAPTVNPAFGGSLSWSREERFPLRMSLLVRQLSTSKWFLAATRRPVAARVVFDHSRRRQVLVGGPALELYRRVQTLVVDYAFLRPIMIHWFVFLFSFIGPRVMRLMFDLIVS